MNVLLRRLQTGDIDQVIEIEREAFSPLWITTPFKRELNNRYACYLVACEAAEEEQPPTDADPEGSRSLWSRVLTSAQQLVPGSQGDIASPTPISGYVSVWYQGDEAHITEIAVRESLRGNGIGELLLIGSLREAVEYGSEVMTLEVRVSNFIAQRLYEKYGFKNVGARKAYYSDNREDAVIMTTNPIKSEEYQSMFRDLQETYLTKWGEIRFQSKTTGSSQS
jgi:ribosomal-protein-alanine N-acetyltransferase